MSQNKIVAECSLTRQACLGRDVVSKRGLGAFERRRQLDGGGALPKDLGTDILSYNRRRCTVVSPSHVL